MDPSREMPLNAVIGSIDRIAASRQVDGVTISGGEPLEQAQELFELLEYLSKVTDDVLLYTGYTREELQAAGYLDKLRLLTAVIVCGPYVAAQNDGRSLRGSSNQEIVFADSQVRQRYEQILSGLREVQPVTANGSTFLIGIV